MHLSPLPTATYVAVYSKAVVLLLLIDHCLVLIPIFVGVQCFVFILLFILCVLLVCKCFDGEERAGCFII